MKMLAKPQLLTGAIFCLPIAIVGVFYLLTASGVSSAFVLLVAAVPTTFYTGVLYNQVRQYQQAWSIQALLIASLQIQVNVLHAALNPVDYVPDTVDELLTKRT